MGSNPIGVIVFFVQHLGHKHECHRAETHSTRIVEEEKCMRGIPFMWVLLLQVIVVIEKETFKFADVVQLIVFVVHRTCRTGNRRSCGE